jgi:hypothetical protein
MRWAVAALATGCVEPGPVEEALVSGALASGTLAPPSEEMTEIQRQIARLNALDVVRVLGVDWDLNTVNVYMLPEQVQEPRVRALADRAELVVGEDRGCDGLDVDAELAALAALHIVIADGLVEDEALPDPSCLHSPCPAELAQEAARCQRLGDLAAIVDAAQGL